MNEHVPNYVVVFLMRLHVHGELPESKIKHPRDRSGLDYGKLHGLVCRARLSSASTPRPSYKLTRKGRVFLDVLLDRQKADECKAKAVNATAVNEGKPEPEKKAGGRPPKSARPKDYLVIAALVKHHKYESGGVVLNYEPAKQDKLATAADVNKATVCRFFKSKFKDKNAQGHDGYVAACQKEFIGTLLAHWQGETLERHAALRDDE